MFFNEKDLRASEERRKDIWREAKQERLAKEARRDPQKSRRSPKINPLWLRVWMLF
jgi:hypothetical protein